MGQRKPLDLPLNLVDRKIDDGGKIDSAIVC